MVLLSPFIETSSLFEFNSNKKRVGVICYHDNIPDYLKVCKAETTFGA